ncbi:hypothetical protein FACS1894147_12140 [Spirochaetia bacterium]|nr:hypothetical protein FACS1894147_12140 [Spirochaetia bacterium]
MHFLKRGVNCFISDALEALIGAMYLDSGYKAAFTFVSGRMRPEILRVLENRHHQDYKSLLQEHCQQVYRTCPVYHLLKRSGPEHERIFWMEVEAAGKTYGPGTGRNKKTAEQEAARIAWEALAPHLEM